MAIIFKAREAELIWEKDGVTPPTTASWYSVFSGGTTSVSVKNFTISPPEGAVDKVDCTGETSGFQNAFYDEKAYGMATLTGTLVLDGDEQEILLMAAGLTGSTTPTSYTDHQFGMSTANKTRTTTGAVCVDVDNATEQVTFVFDNCRVTKFGDVKLTGADGHLEVDFELVTLPKDFFWEYKD